MENDQLRFRTAAVGGFQKQDVLNYLERAAQEHREKLDQLRKKLNDLQAERDAAAAQASESREEAARLEEEGRALRDRLAQREEELTAAQARAGELEGQLAAAQSRADRLAAGAEAFAELKDRAAGIELDAHARAQAVEEASRRKVQKTQQELLAWLDQVQAGYARLRSELDAALTQMGDQLTRTGETVREMKTDFSGEDQALKDIRQAAESILPPAPKPLVEVDAPEAAPFTQDP